MIRIRKARKKDIPAILELWKEFMDFHRKGDSFYTRSKRAHGIYEKYVTKTIRSRNGQVLVALDGSDVVAYSLSNIKQSHPVLEHSRCGFIADVAVTSTHRRRGIGKKLLREIKRWFASRNVTRIELRVSVHNPVATSFWRKQGFKPYVHVLYREMGGKGNGGQAGI